MLRNPTRPGELSLVASPRVIWLCSYALWYPYYETSGVSLCQLCFKISISVEMQLPKYKPDKLIDIVHLLTKVNLWIWLILPLSSLPLSVTNLLRGDRHQHSGVLAPAYDSWVGVGPVPFQVFSASPWSLSCITLLTIKMLRFRQLR